MDKIDEVIIVGGGSSITPQIEALTPLLASKCTILTNYAYKHFKGTFLAFIDRNFYKSANLDKNPDIYQELKELPLIIGCRSNPDLDKIIHPNTIMMPCPKKELPNPHLTGIFALAVAEKLEPKTIFLLGFDWTKRPIETIDRNNYKGKTNLNIHYYKQEIPHGGLGYVGFYENHNPENYFKYFKNSKSKIYNISPNSNIETFEKISYITFFNLLSTKIYNQAELRKAIKNILFID